MRQETAKTERVNPLDAIMTKAQVVRRKFKSALPRTPKDLKLDKIGALGRTAQLFGQFRDEMAAAGLDVRDVGVALVCYQPQEELAPVQTIPLPEHTLRDATPGEQVNAFGEKLWALAEPVIFLGLLFHQTDHEAADKPEKHYTVFATPFVSSPDGLRLLRAAKLSQVKGGFKATAN
jgi:hypothetical protein